jgi:glycosyltransferase involved in cell wall biosynthesis
MMKILYFYQYFTTPKGSWSTRVYEFARRWVKEGDSVTVVTSVYDKSDLKPSGFLSRFDIEGIDVRVINVRLSNKHGVLFRLWTFVAYALVACWYALTRPADVVVASSGPITVGLPGLLARYVRRRPLVFEVRDLWPEGAVQLGVLRHPLVIALARFMERRCYRAASRVVALSDGMADWIRTQHGCLNVDVVPNASDNELFGNPKMNGPLPTWTQGKKLVLYTGTIGLMDDCRQIVQLAERLQARGLNDIAVVLLGDGKERAELEAAAQQAGLKNIHFLGLVTKKEVASWLRRASCALLAFRAVPCLDTVSPNKMFDAFAAGIPVVQATQGWIKRLLEREQCGLTAPSGDADALAEAVRRVAQEEGLRAKLAANAQRVARELFDRAVLASKMRQALAGAVAGPK